VEPLPSGEKCVVYAPILSDVMRVRSELRTCRALYKDEHYRGFRRLRFALPFVAAMSVSDLYKTLLPSLSMGTAFSTNR